MTTTLTRTAADDLLARLAGDAGAVGRAGPAHLAELRRRGRERFEERGLPTLKDEEWRFTDVAPLAKLELEPAPRSAPDAAAIEPFAYPGIDLLVFVDGRFAPALSSLGALPSGVVAGGLAEALEDPATAAVVERHLGRHADLAHPFGALNTALFEDGALLHLPRGSVLERPLHLLYVATTGPTPRAAFPRTLMVLEEASQAIVVERYVTLGEGVHFTCPVTELAAAPGAVLDHYKVQQECRDAFDLGVFQIHQERASTVSSHTITTGGGLVRNDTGVVLDGEGGDCTLNGLYVINGRQQVDNHMRVEHAKPHCHSYELFKGILDERARAVFNGRIYVHPGAQKTDAKQSSRNLLLSREALVNSNPQLEIFADDVKCTHGSTVGQLDDTAIFYLRSRGIGEKAARSLLTYAFASDIIERIKVEPVRRELAEFLFARLPRGEIVRQAV